MRRASFSSNRYLQRALRANGQSIISGLAIDQVATGSSERQFIQSFGARAGHFFVNGE